METAVRERLANVQHLVQAENRALVAGINTAMNQLDNLQDAFVKHPIKRVETTEAIVGALQVKQLSVRQPVLREKAELAEGTVTAEKIQVHFLNVNAKLQTKHAEVLLEVLGECLPMKHQSPFRLMLRLRLLHHPKNSAQNMKSIMSALAVALLDQ